MWYQKLVQLGVPCDLATRMSPALETLPYSPEQFANINQLVEVMQREGFQALEWWDDLINLFVGMIPGIVLTVVGGAMAYFLRNVKVKGVPLGLIGLAPMGVGIWLMVEPFLQPTTPTA